MRLGVMLAIRWMVLGAGMLSAQEIQWYAIPEGADFEILREAHRWSLHEAWLRGEASTGRAVAFAMNAGMFHPDGTPVGLHVHRGTTTVPLNRETARPGNFFLQPNGVFGTDTSGTWQVATTTEATGIPWLEATQSGPMLLIDGQLNPLFHADSPNAYIRNGVGRTADGTVWLACSRVPMNFYTFAEAMRARGCSDALYLDGAISQAWEASASPAPPMNGSFGPVLLVFYPPSKP